MDEARRRLFSALDSACEGVVIQIERANTERVIAVLGSGSFLPQLQKPREDAALTTIDAW